jgi:hypothetical protein
MGKRGGIAAAAIAAAFFSAALGIATAQGEPIDLQWRAPAGCPDGESVKAEVRRLLRGGKAAASKPIRVAATVTASAERGGGFRVRIETPGGESGVKRGRELHGASCAAVADATALVIALMIDPSAAAAASSTPAVSPAASSAEPPPPAGSAAPAERAAPPSPPPPSIGSPPPSTGLPPPSTGSPPPSTGSPPNAPARLPAPSTPPAAPPASRARPAVSFGGRAFVVGDVGAMPAFSFGLGGAAAVIYGGWRFELGLAGWPDRRVFSRDLLTAGVDVYLLSAFLGSCFEFPLGPVRLAPCLHLDLGGMHAAAFGVTEAGEGAHFWLGAGPGGVLLWSPLKWLDLIAEVSVVVAPIQPEFVIENVGVIYRPSAIAFRPALGAGVRF